MRQESRSRRDGSSGRSARHQSDKAASALDAAPETAVALLRTRELRWRMRWGLSMRPTLAQRVGHPRASARSIRIARRNAELMRLEARPSRYGSGRQAGPDRQVSRGTDIHAYTALRTSGPSSPAMADTPDMPAVLAIPTTPSSAAVQSYCRNCRNCSTFLRSVATGYGAQCNYEVHEMFHQLLCSHGNRFRFRHTHSFT